MENNTRVTGKSILETIIDKVFFTIQREWLKLSLFILIRLTINLWLLILFRFFICVDVSSGDGLKKIQIQTTQSRQHHRIIITSEISLYYIKT